MLIDLIFIVFLIEPNLMQLVEWVFIPNTLIFIVIFIPDIPLPFFHFLICRLSFVLLCDS